MTQAALYLRSSKDRSDVSIDAQSRELIQLATRNGHTVIEQYTDVVESAKDIHRPGFQAMLRDLKSSQRRWSVLYMVDTSRLSRRRYVAHVFKHECEKRNVKIVYSKVPEVDPISQVILESVLEAMDEVHSLMSREKGLAGMAENIRQGNRAGGRAPFGYRLAESATGAVRDGQTVTKTTLEPTADAPIIGKYLAERASGATRKRAQQVAGLKKSASTLIGYEWNALTYAGHTVWNVHNETHPGEGYRGKPKRRPRAEWVINRHTHHAVITDQQAETLLANLNNSTTSKAVSAARTGNSHYLLTGLLKTPSGQAWIGNKQTHYRTKPHNGIKGKWVNARDVDQAVTQQIISDMTSADFVRAITNETHRLNPANQTDPAADLRDTLNQVTRQISKAMDLALNLAEPGPATRKIDQLEQQRQTLIQQITTIEREHSTQAALSQITEEQIRHLLNDIAADLSNTPTTEWKEIIRKMVDRIELDPATLECTVHYRIPVADRLSVASPRGCADWPVLLAESAVTRSLTGHPVTAQSSA